MPTFFFAAGFLAAFLAAGFLAAFFGAAFLATFFLATFFLATFLAAVFFTAFLAAGFFLATAFFAFFLIIIVTPSWFSYQTHYVPGSDLSLNAIIINFLLTPKVIFGVLASLRSSSTAFHSVCGMNINMRKLWLSLNYIVTSALQHLRNSLKIPALKKLFSFCILFQL